MQKLDKLTSTAIPLPTENIDTDQIIPARFLKSIDKQGFGDNVFRDWRFDKNNNPNPNFVLNNPTYKGEILLAGNNFGCGSSRNTPLGHSQATDSKSLFRAFLLIFLKEML